MNWDSVGNWLKSNAATGASLVGSLLTGNVPAALAAGVAMVSSATGSADPQKALERLQADPQTMIKLRELAYQNEASIRAHIETVERQRLEDLQAEHSTTQSTIQAGDQSADEYVRRTRPGMARGSWTATVAYCLGCWVFRAFTGTDIFDAYLAGVLSAPAWGYIGFRTGDKFAESIRARK